jgi:hypothetical protein
MDRVTTRILENSARIVRVASIIDWPDLRIWAVLRALGNLSF